MDVITRCKRIFEFWYILDLLFIFKNFIFSIDGAVVLKEDAGELVEEWERIESEREAKEEEVKLFSMQITFFTFLTSN